MTTGCGVVPTNIHNGTDIGVLKIDVDKSLSDKRRGNNKTHNGKTK